MKIKTYFFLFALGLFSTAYAYQGYENRPESYFYVKNGKVSKRVAKTGAGGAQGYIYKDLHFKNGKTLSGVASFDESEKVSWTINDKKAIKVKRPKGVPKGYQCLKEQSSKTEIYCVKWF